MSSPGLSITEESTVEEIFSAIGFSFEPKEFEEAKRILIRREEELNREIRRLKKDYKSLKEERDLLVEKQALSELGTFRAEEELRKKRGRLSEEQELVLDPRNGEESNGNMMMELKRENEVLKKEIELYSKKFPEYLSRISSMEKTIAGLYGVDALNFRKGNGYAHSPEITSPRVQTSCSRTEVLDSNLQEEEGTSTMETARSDTIERRSNEGCNVQNSAPAVFTSNLPESEKNAPDQQKETSEATIPSSALLPEPAACEVEVCVREQAILIPADFLEPEIVHICSSSDSDDESIADSSCVENILQSLKEEKALKSSASLFPL